VPRLRQFPDTIVAGPRYLRLQTPGPIEGSGVCFSRKCQLEEPRHAEVPVRVWEDLHPPIPQESTEGPAALLRVTPERLA
jgi:hypothetical protein